MADTNSILGTAGDLSRIIAEYERQQAAGRQAAGTANQNQSIAAANLFRTRMDAALKGPEQSAHATAVGDTLANVQPFAWNGTSMVGNIPVPQGSGGLTPANYGPATRQAGRDLASVSAARVKSPAFGLPDVPTLAPLPTASGLDNGLSKAAAIAAGAGALPGGGSVDLSKLGKDFMGLFHHNNGQSGGLDTNDPNTFVGPMDPNTFVGPQQEPGTTAPPSPDDPDYIAAYDAWLRQQQDETGGQGGGSQSGSGGDWWDE